MPDEAWSVGIDTVYRPEERRYPGHMVLEVDDHLLDLSAGQFTRADHDLLVPPSIWTPLDGPGGERGIAGLDLELGGVILYADVEGHHPYVHSGAWRTPKNWAGPVIRRMKARLS